MRVAWLRNSSSHKVRFNASKTAAFRRAIFALYGDVGVRSIFVMRKCGNQMQTTLRLSQSNAGSKWVIGALDDDPIFESRHFSDAFCGRALLHELHEAILAQRYAIIDVWSGSGVRRIVMIISKMGSFLGKTVFVCDGRNSDEKIFLKWE